jgi:hypothetical protein
MLYAIIIVVCAIVSWKWVQGIDYMRDFHSDYKGEDFL